MRPRAGKQRCLVTHRGERRDRNGGRDAGAAVRAQSTAVVNPTFGEQADEGVGRQKRAVTGEHTADGQVFGAGDVSGDTIDRLDVTAEAFGCARVEQRVIASHFSLAPYSRFQYNIKDIMLY